MGNSITHRRRILLAKKGRLVIRSGETDCHELKPGYKPLEMWHVLFHWWCTRTLFHTNLQRCRLQYSHPRDGLSIYHRVERTGNDRREDEGATAKPVQRSTGILSSN